jgi:hypothetical protein
MMTPTKRIQALLLRESCPLKGQEQPIANFTRATEQPDGFSLLLQDLQPCEGEAGVREKRKAAAAAGPRPP